MTPIDLFDYIEADRKIPARVLKHKSPETSEVSSYHIIASYMVDTMMILSLTGAAAVLTGVGAKTFMITPALMTAFNKIHFASFVTSLLPLIFTSYFFCSFFFNRGQSYGMKMFKTRIDMPEMSYRSSLFWGLFSAGALMTGGLTLLSYQWIQNKGWGQFKDHDHLYFELVAERSYSPIDLVAATEAFHQIPAAPQEAEENYLKAA